MVKGTFDRVKGLFGIERSRLFREHSTWFRFRSKSVHARQAEEGDMEILRYRDAQTELKFPGTDKRNKGMDCNFQKARVSTLAQKGQI
jgi:hypothetical protein